MSHFLKVWCFLLIRVQRCYLYNFFCLEFNGAKGRPLANGYHSNGVSFLEELQDAVCNEKYEKYESIHDSLYLVTDQRVVGQIKDLICSQLGRYCFRNRLL